MDNKKLKEERIRLFRDSASFRPVSRIPHFANAVTWKVFDAGHTLDEALVDLAVMRNASSTSLTIIQSTALWTPA